MGRVHNPKPRDAFLSIDLNSKRSRIHRSRKGEKINHASGDKNDDEPAKEVKNHISRTIQVNQEKIQVALNKPSKNRCEKR